MIDTAFVKTIMEYGALWAFAVFVCLIVWKKVLPWGDKYIESIERLHDSLGERMKDQQSLCNAHGKVIEGHDRAARAAALEACKFCRLFVKKEFPSSSVEADEACDQIERIIGEA